MSDHSLQILDHSLQGIMAAAVLLSVGCHKESDVIEIDTTRPLTSVDQPPKLMASSRERFIGSGHSGPSPSAGPMSPARYAGVMPDGWKELPGTSIRLLNYAIGPDGNGEVYVSQTRGGMLGNVERWRGQFGIANTVGEDLLEMPRVVLMGAGEGLLVEATGTYSPGMGRPAMPGHAMAGVVGVLQDGGIFTVKMTGPEALVNAERGRFLEFCQNLKPIE